MLEVFKKVDPLCCSIYFRYRHEFKSQELWTEIKFVLEKFAEPLTNLFEVRNIALITNHISNVVFKIISFLTRKQSSFSYLGPP